MARLDHLGRHPEGPDLMPVFMSEAVAKLPACMEPFAPLRNQQGLADRSLDQCLKVGRPRRLQAPPQCGLYRKKGPHASNNEEFILVVAVCEEITRGLK